MRPARIAALHAILLLGAVGVGAPLQAHTPPVADRVFAPPENEPMLLTRTLRRELSDGKAIVATRRYRVSFTRDSRGWMLDGELVASEIDCPPALAALAAIERQRPDDALFPIRLDPAGVILPRDGAPLSPDGPSWRAALDKAIALATHRFEPGGDGTALKLLVQQLQAVAGAATLSHWPNTLFLPEPAATREERKFQLPDAEVGTEEGSIVAQLERLPAEGVATMGRAERMVVTEVAGTRRTTREQLSLERIGG